MSGPAVSVIVPAYRAAGTIGETLEGLARQDLEAPYEVIVIDNGSDDGTAEIAARAPGPVSVVRRDPPGPGEWRGPGSSRNIGAGRASGPVLALTDADCFPQPGWLREGLRAMAGADLVQGLVRPDPRTPRQPFDRTIGVGRALGLFECANLFVRRELFLDLGGYEDWLRGSMDQPFGEDVWFGYRAVRAGARIEFCREAEVHHAVFRRGAGAYVAERRRAKFFPSLARRIPELRDDFLYRRWFLSRRSAEFDLAVIGVVGAAALAVLAGPVGLLTLLAGVPYAASVTRESRRWGRRAPRVGAAELAADAVGFAALASGSIRSRSVVL